ncbi:hypothetical protein QT641_22500, partial [Xanthomonas citri pv. citri]
LGLLEDGDDLAVGETGCLHGTSSEKGTRKFHFWRQLTCGGITLQPGVVGVKFWRKGEQKGGRIRTIPCTDRVLQILKRRKANNTDGPFAGLRRIRATQLWNLGKAKTALDTPRIS